MRRHKRIQIKKLPFGVYVFFGFLVVFMVTNIWFAISSSTLGSKIVDIEQKESALVLENSELSEKYMKSQSLKDASELSQRLGFVKPDKIIYPEDQEFAVKLP